MPGAAGQTVLHASCVALNGRGLLITGASGSGKSTLALTLMAFGAGLVADDRTRLDARETGIFASAPPRIAGLVEARGLGLLNATPHGPVPLTAVVDLDRAEPDRLPDHREMTLLGQSVTLLLNVDGPHFAPSLIQFLKAGRRPL